jgi:hypothetical protein
LRSFINHIEWLLIVVFLVTGAAFIAVLQYYLNDWTLIVTDAVVSAILIAAGVWAGILIVKAYPTRVGILIYSLLAGAAIGVAVWYADKIFLKWWLDAEKTYIVWLHASLLPRLILAILINCWLMTLAATGQRAFALEEQFKNLSDAATLHREAELFKLRQQLQPHFLYNSLNSISALILIQPDKAQEMIGKLSDFLRNSVKREARDYIPVDEELEYIEAYLAIEAVRFGDRLEVVYNKHFTDDSSIPPFLLQPILENAIKFGLYGRTGHVRIQMDIALKNAYLIIIITNPFDPQNRPPSGTGFGLEGIQRRLYLLYGRTDLLETKQEEDFFTAVLKIPQNHV